MNEKKRLFFTPLHECWQLHQAEDGTLVRSRCVLTGLKRLIGQFNAEGEPVYEPQFHTIYVTHSPENLQKDFVPTSTKVAEAAH